jgi:hypothetical protein
MLGKYASVTVFSKCHRILLIDASPLPLITEFIWTTSRRAITSTGKHRNMGEECATMKEWWVIVMLTSGSGTGDYEVRAGLPVFATQEACHKGLAAYEQGLSAAYKLSIAPGFHMPIYICKYEQKTN